MDTVDKSLLHMALLSWKHGDITMIELKEAIDKLYLGGETMKNDRINKENQESCPCGYTKECPVWCHNGHKNGLCLKNENKVDDGLLYEFILELVSKTAACQMTFGNTHDINIDSELSRLKDIIKFNKKEQGFVTLPEDVTEKEYKQFVEKFSDTYVEYKEDKKELRLTDEQIAVMIKLSLEYNAAVVEFASLIYSSDLDKKSRRTALSHFDKIRKDYLNKLEKFF